MNANLRHYEESHERQQELFHLLLQCKPFGILNKPFPGLRAMRASLEALGPFFGLEIHLFRLSYHHHLLNIICRIIIFVLNLIYPTMFSKTRFAWKKPTNLSCQSAIFWSRKHHFSYQENTVSTIYCIYVYVFMHSNRCKIFYQGIEAIIM